MLLQLEVEVRLEVVQPLGEPRQAEAPQPDPREQVFAEAADADVGAEVTVRAADQLEVAADLGVGADRQEVLLLDRAQQHRLLVGPQLADLVEEEQRRRRRRASRPARALAAPVNEPRTWPKSVLIAVSPRTVAQFTSTSGPLSWRRCFLSS